MHFDPDFLRASWVKTNQARYGHARKWGVPHRDLILYGDWDPVRMHNELLHVCWFGCQHPLHRTPWRRITDKADLDRVHLNIVDPDDEPIYPHNVRWACKPCNLAQGGRTLMAMARKEAAAKRMLVWEPPLPGFDWRVIDLRSDTA